jgi:hypothetical protein
MELKPAQSVALGITVDSEHQVVVLVSIALDEGEDNVYAVGLSPEVARHVGRTARDLSREADKLQDELDDLDPEEIVDRLTAIQARYLTAPSPPGETV